MKDKRNCHGAVNKSSSEQQYRKSDAVTFAVLNFEAVHLALPGLTAGWQTKSS